MTFTPHHESVERKGKDSHHAENHSEQLSQHVHELARREAKHHEQGSEKGKNGKAAEHEKLAASLLNAHIKPADRLHSLLQLHKSGVHEIKTHGPGGETHDLLIKDKTLHGKVLEVDLYQVSKHGTTTTDKLMLKGVSTDGTSFRVAYDSQADAHVDAHLPTNVHADVHKDCAPNHPTKHVEKPVEHAENPVGHAARPRPERESSVSSAFETTAASQPLAGRDQPNAPLFTGLFQGDQNSASFTPASFSPPTSYAPTSYEGLTSGDPWSPVTTPDGKLAFTFSGGWIDGDGTVKLAGDTTYQNATSLRFSNGASLDTETDAFVVFPPNILKQNNIHIGDAVWLRDITTGKMVACLVGDVGPQKKSRFGEASINAWKQLGYDVSATKNPPADRQFQFIVAPGSGHRKADPVRDKNALYAMLQTTDSSHTA